jgi:hypothetical protein
MNRFLCFLIASSTAGCVAEPPQQAGGPSIAVPASEPTSVQAASAPSQPQPKVSSSWSKSWFSLGSWLGAKEEHPLPVGPEEETLLVRNGDRFDEVVRGKVIGTCCDPRHTRGADRANAIAEDWKPVPRGTVPTQFAAPNPDVVGRWHNGMRGYVGNSLYIKPGEGGTFRMTFSSGGCLDFWSLDRVGVLRDGCLEPDRPVVSYAEDVSGVIYVTSIAGETVLVLPGGLDVLRTERIKTADDVRWCSDILVRVKPTDPSNVYFDYLDECEAAWNKGEGDSKGPGCGTLPPSTK